MIKKLVKYYDKNNTDQYGMPDPYYSYLVIASLQDNQNTAVATVISVSGSSSVPNPPHFAINRSNPKQDLVQDAYDGIISRLETLNHLDLTKLIKQEVEY